VAVAAQKPGAAAKPKAPAKPNIVFVLADDLGWGDVDCNNPEAKTRTPNMDALMRMGVNFTEAHSAASVSVPSRYGILTGRNPFRKGELDKGGESGYIVPQLETGRTTLPMMLRSAGYRTGVVGKWHQGMIWPKDADGNTLYDKELTQGPNSRGFDYSFVLPGSLDMPPYVFVRNGFVVDPNICEVKATYAPEQVNGIPEWDPKKKILHWENGVWWRNGDMSCSFRLENALTTFMNEGISFIERSAKEPAPFFLYLPLPSPHTPWLPSPEFAGKAQVGKYGDYVYQTDYVLGRVMEALKQAGVFDNTLIIFSSDNGAPWPQKNIDEWHHQSNWGRRGQKFDIWDGGHHIPLAMYWSGHSTGGSVWSEPVSLTDLFATCADIVGYKLKSGEAEDSFSLYSVLRGGKENPRPYILFQSSWPELAVRQGKYKYISPLQVKNYFPKAGSAPQPAKIPAGKKGQLYDVIADPLESNDLADSYPQIAQQMNDLLEKLIMQGYSREMK